MSHARVGRKEPGPRAGAFLAPAAARVGTKKPGKLEAENTVSGERLLVLTSLLDTSA